MTKWSKDSEGNEYRYVGSWVDGNRHTEYRPFWSKESGIAFKRFVVSFRGETWHVSAPSAEAAHRIFASECLSTSPCSKEVTVVEVLNASK